MEELQSEIRRVVKVIFGVEMGVRVEVANGQKMADGREVDFASNVAMQLAGKVGRNPREIAEEILRGCERSDFEGEVAGPGFLNFVASDKYYLEGLMRMVEDFEGSVRCDKYAGQTVICEFSDPNPFKVLHVGHLYTSVVGDGIARLFEYAGAKVVRANFGGDVGLHVAKTLYALGEGAEIFGSPSEVAEELAKSYVRGTRAYEEDEKAKAEITRLNREIYQINEENLHDTQLAEVYWLGREKSYEYFREFYAKLGIEFDKYYPESTVAKLGVETVRREQSKGVYTESEGAVIFEGEKYGLHTRVFINKEGLPTYETKDVGLIMTKWQDFKFDKSVVITGSEQKDYMAVVLKSVEQYAPELVERTVHLTHGMVKLPGKVKMSSRLGNFLRAVDVIEMVKQELEGDERVVMAALKYAFLKYKMGGDIEFDVKSSVAVTGNSGVYLEYAVVRARKILEKIGRDGAKVSGQERDGFATRSYELSRQERVLLKKMSQYRGVLAEAVEEMAPYKVCGYLYELAQEFSRFYENVQVAGSEFEVERGRMVAGYLRILEHGLGILGIETVEEM